MPGVESGLHHDTQVLLRRVDGLVALLRLRHHRIDPVAVEQFASALRALVIGSGEASAAERARVRATVHYYMLMAGRRGLLPGLAGVGPRTPAGAGGTTPVPDPVQSTMD
ncbi:hypothetical protein ACN27F_07865 [Solwaraspora sp. WMMB335]|uniref:hypothetical protein n=1 Tax=Solwaraspora sp. WMMB335 TaxID=3404118 RepID=UPI003B95792C